MKKQKTIHKIPFISIVIATYNSAKLLPQVLRSIKSQTYPKSSIEILVIDGGSSDATKTIARKFGCRIIDNPKVAPVWAKHIGFRESKGTYVMYLDSDEVIVQRNSLKKKIQLIMSSDNIHAVTGSGYRNPNGYGILNRYINEFGDPFSYFIYRLSKDERFFIQSMRAKYTVTSENLDFVVFDFTGTIRLPIIELVAMGSIVDKKYFSEKISYIDSNPGLIAHLFYLLVTKGGRVGIVKNDPLLHYSAAKTYGYLKKIRSRIINNIFSTGAEGFRGRDNLGGNAWHLKYLFIPYAVTIILPVFDAIYLAITRKHAGYLIHIPLTLYTVLAILYYTFMRVVGMRYNTNSYG